ncbi:MAG: class I SAM-dependent methyltransferase [Elusimicrobia bacterium]|nr:class I SAM-dependent methyltransferase [Elusimicrobiota bacterium]
MRNFNQVYYESMVWADTHWLGVPSQQNPCDNWMMQQIIAEVKPDYIIETGTASGGTTLFYAVVLGLVNETGRIITVDIEPRVAEASKFPLFRKKVEVITSDSTAPELLKKLSDRVRGRKVLVTLDSWHKKEHVLKELRLYSKLVSKGSYLVVQDTNVNGNPVRPNHGEGPNEALQEFLKETDAFVIDKSREKFLLTFYPSGYLKKVR